MGRRSRRALRPGRADAAGGSRRSNRPGVRRVRRRQVPGTATTWRLQGDGHCALPPARPRHRRATLWHLSGVPAAQAAGWLGHSAQEHLDLCARDARPNRARLSGPAQRGKEDPCLKSSRAPTPATTAAASNASTRTLPYCPRHEAIDAKRKEIQARRLRERAAERRQLTERDRTVLAPVLADSSKHPISRAVRIPYGP